MAGCEPAVSACAGTWQFWVLTNGLHVSEDFCGSQQVICSTLSWVHALKMAGWRFG
jgi:hypothetical protein